VGGDVEHGNQIFCGDGSRVCRVDDVVVDTWTADDPATACSSAGN
jgi:hypothetical protein